MSLNALALLIAAVLLRCYALDVIPGFNGDEAWYGVRSWEIPHGGVRGWTTPTGNPLNPFFVGPLALLHLCFPPSLLLLRAAALAGGIAALAINWLLCRWIYDRRTAAISTVALAVLPIDIAYSRFAWDAGQSLAATLPVLYFSLAAIRFPERFGRWIAAAILAQSIAVWVHPTNIFVGAAIAAACAVGFSSKKKKSVIGDMGIRDMGATAGLSSSAEITRTAGPASSGTPCQQTVKSIVPCGKTPAFYRAANALMLVLAGLLLAAWMGAAGGEKQAVWERVSRHWENLRDAAQAIYLYPQLFTGGTVYRDIAGSRSWIGGWGIDVGLFWACLLGSGWIIWINRSRLGKCDGVLPAAWAMTLAAFVLLAGPKALIPGQERFAVCLIAPTALLAARGGALAWDMASPKWRVALAAATLAGWFPPADFYVHYVRFIEHTGGQAHMTFRAAPVEPKQAALRYILDESARTGAGRTRSGELWIVCSQWWIRQPIRYLALGEHGVRVPDPIEVRSSDEYRRALAEGGVWFVEFSDTDELRQVERQLAGKRLTRQEFLDFGRKPVLCVLHADREP